MPQGLGVFTHLSGHIRTFMLAYFKETYFEGVLNLDGHGIGGVVSEMTKGCHGPAAVAIMQ